MKKLFKYLVIIIFLSFINVYAVDRCSTDEMNRLKELAKNVDIKYEYDLKIIKQEDDENIIVPRYRIQVLNYNDNLKIYYKDSSYSQTDLESIEEITTNYLIQEGDKLDVYIYSHTTNLCTDTMLRKITITFPYYNQYYYENKDKCQQYPEFKYCEEFKDLKEKSFTEIDEEFDNYIKSLKIANVKNDLSKYWYLLIILLLLIIFISFIIVKKNKKDEL